VHLGFSADVVARNEKRKLKGGDKRHVPLKSRSGRHSSPRLGKVGRRGSASTKSSPKRHIAAAFLDKPGPSPKTKGRGGKKIENHLAVLAKGRRQKKEARGRRGGLASRKNLEIEQRDIGELPLKASHGGVLGSKTSNRRNKRWAGVRVSSDLNEKTGGAVAQRRWE